MKWLALLLLAVAPAWADTSVTLQSGRLEVMASSDDLAHPDVHDSNYVLVACRTSNPDTMYFTIRVFFTIDGKPTSRFATIPRLPDALPLPTVGTIGVIANRPWTTFRFYLPTGGLTDVSVEELLEPVTLPIRRVSR